MSKKPKQNSKQLEIEFMKKEYTGISKAFGDLNYVILKVFHFYLLIAAFPFSIIAILYRDRESSQGQEFQLFDVPQSIASLFLIISILGFLSALSMIHLRMEQILYARTINCIRRYFYDLSKNKKKFANYLSLPLTDEMPPFLEWGRSLFLQIIIMGFINSAYLSICLLSLNISCYGIWIILLLSLHIGAYIVIAKRREKKYTVKYTVKCQIQNEVEKLGNI
jgi:hypothetical protein